MVYKDPLLGCRMKYEHGVVLQDGEGLGDWWNKIKEYGAKAKEVASKAGDLYASEAATIVKNLLPNSDENARPAFAGEKHAILKLPNGKWGLASYAGPGTKVLARVKRGDPPRTMVDKIAKRHDIDFALSDADPQKVREADNRMIKSLELAKKDKKDSDFNINAGLAIMQAKTMAEDLNLLKKGSFASKQPLTAEDKELLEKESKKLQQEGFGKGAKKELLKHVYTGKGVRQAGSGVVRSGDAKMSGSGVRQAGSGVRQSGSGVFRPGDTKMTGGALPFMKNFVPVALKIAKKDGKLSEMKDFFKNPLIMKGTKNILTGSGKPSKEMEEVMGDKAIKYAELIKSLAGKTQSDMKKIMKGSGIFNDIAQGLAYGWNQAKGLAEKLPVVGEAIKKIPAVPGAAESYDELLERTGHKLGATTGPAFPWTREEWDKMSGQAKKFVSNWYQKELEKYRQWLVDRSATSEGAHIPRPEMSPKPTDAEIEAINKKVADDPLVKFAKKVPKAKLDKSGRVMRDKDGVAITGKGRKRRV